MSGPVRGDGYDPEGLESLLLRIANEFIDLPIEAVDDKIVQTLEALARFADCVRGSIVLLDAEDETITNTHEWCLDPSDSQQHLLQGIPFATFGHYESLLRSFTTIAIGSLADIPEQADGERRWAMQHGFRALLFVPMRVGSSLIGALGFYGRVGEDRAWPAKYVYLLEFAAVGILNALERRQRELERRELAETARTARLLQIERALRTTTDRDSMLRGALDEVLAAFDCSGALLLRPEDATWTVMTAWPAGGGGDVATSKLPMAPSCEHLLATLRDADAAVSLAATDLALLPPPLAEQLQGTSGLAIRIAPDSGAPWWLSVHDTRSRKWNAEDRGLLQDVAWRIGDALVAARTLRELQESEARFAAIFDGAPVMIHSLDADGRIQLWNHDCETRLGWTRDEIRQQDDPLPLLLDSEDARRQKRDSLARLDGEFRRYAVRARSGETRTQLWADFRLPSGQVICIGHDVTEQIHQDEARLELERRMLHTQKLESLGVLAGGIAHDFNNLLVGVLGQIELAKESIDPGQVARSHLVDAEQAALQLAELSKQLLAYSGKRAFVVEPSDLSALVQTMRPMLTTSVQNRASVEYRLGTDLPAVVADATQIRQVVLNLVINASEALGGQDGRIVVTTGSMHCDRDHLQATYVDDDLPPGRYVFLEVSDTGKGMSKATLGRIFEPFYSTKLAGRGLGLAAALGIARSHKGAFRVDSAPGRGSTFRMLLPASAENAAVSARESASGWRGEGVVLVADDDQRVLEVASRMIERLGFAVITAVDGSEAVARFAERRDEIVAVVLDVTMPILDGPQALARIRSIDATVPVVLSSGYSRPAVIDDRATGFLEKPFTQASVEAALRALF